MTSRAFFFGWGARFLACPPHFVFALVFFAIVRPTPTAMLLLRLFEGVLRRHMYRRLETASVTPLKRFVALLYCADKRIIALAVFLWWRGGGEGDIINPVLPTLLTFILFTQDNSPSNVQPDPNVRFGLNSKITEIKIFVKFARGEGF